MLQLSFKCYLKSCSLGGPLTCRVFLQVTPGSKAAIANLCIGDQIIAIDGVNTGNMTHLEAQNKIKGCADELTLTVSRYDTNDGWGKGGCGVSSSYVLVWQHWFV